MSLFSSFNTKEKVIIILYFKVLSLPNNSITLLLLQTREATAAKNQQRAKCELFTKDEGTIHYGVILHTQVLLYL